MSKITVAGVRSNVAELLEYSLETKKRNFLGKNVVLDVEELKAGGNALLTSFLVQRPLSFRSV